MQLPFIKSDDLTLSLIQTKWKSVIDPVVKNPANSSILLRNITLKVGANVINHRLGKDMTGWQIVDINGAAQIYRSNELNDLTLTLTSDAAVTVSLLVF